MNKRFIKKKKTKIKFYIFFHNYEKNFSNNNLIEFERFSHQSQFLSNRRCSNFLKNEKKFLGKGNYKIQEPSSIPIEFLSLPLRFRGRTISNQRETSDKTEERGD